MEDKRDYERREEDSRTEEGDEGGEPETERHPVPGIRHAPEPSAENIMPVEDEPGTL